MTESISKNVLRAYVTATTASSDDELEEAIADLKIASTDSIAGAFLSSLALIQLAWPALLPLAVIGTMTSLVLMLKRLVS
jgi:hypothetical protein